MKVQTGDIMRCIFCKQFSNSSRSVEHIIPESFGNTEHILALGIVCDKCNNYFADKVEKPFLQSDSILAIRHNQQVPNKRGLIPPLKAIHFESGVSVHLDTDSIYPIKEQEFSKFLEVILRLGKGRLVIPVYPPEPSPYVTARFLCKIALEALAHRLISFPSGLNEIVDKEELDPIRNYVRYGDTNQSVWQYNEREIYDQDTAFSDPDGNSYQMLHEFMFLLTTSAELIFVIAFWGVEYAVSIERAKIDGYLQWLQENDNKSPLYI